MAKPVVGRGLGALLGSSPFRQQADPFNGPEGSRTPAGHPPASEPQSQSAAPDTRERVENIALTRLRPCSVQPRRDFPQESLRELAESIKAQGIIQPLIARKQGEFFEIIAGERRWRAAQLAGLNEVPVVVRLATDQAVLEMALIENLQRENLNPIDEAQGYFQLVNQFKMTQEEAADKVGKSRAVVANVLRLLKLAPEIQGFLRDGRLSVGHAKVILGLDAWDEQMLAAERILKKSLNVRQTEELVAFLQNTPAASGSSKKKSGAPPDVHVTDMEHKLVERLGTKVRLRYHKGKGSLEVRFYSDDELERILKIVGIELD